MKFTPAIPAVPIQTVAYSPESSTKSECKTTQKEFIANLRAQRSSISKKPTGKAKLVENEIILENEEKQDSDAMHDMPSFDISEVPTPVCSCTGVSRKCYKAGPGAWQSTCCTTSLSVYPLPSSMSRPGKRVNGRKITMGAYMKVLRGLVKDGHDISLPVDLKNYWGKHGTNKFVTIN